jgi:processive 1,2-diacylglycerol beta-glucosyltransferase
MSNPQRVLLIGASVGAGHNQAARALQAYLTAERPDLDVTRIDVLDYVPRPFRRWYAGGYELAVTKFPRLYGLGYRLTDRPTGPGRTLSERRKLAWERLWLGRLGRFVRDHQPDLVLHTHFLAPPYIARLIDRGQIACRQRVVVTDIVPHRWWYARHIERYYTAQPVGREVISRWAVPDEQITVSGMPIAPKWTAPLASPAELRTAWNLPPDRRIVLLSGGTEFVCGPVVPIAHGLARRGDLCVVVLAGRNKKLLGQLARLDEAATGCVVPVSFTDRLPELAELAELMLTKAGGMTSAECLAKDLPAIFLRPVPGQEALNASTLAQAGTAIVTQTRTEAITQASELLDDTARLAAMSQTAAGLYRPGTETICADIDSPAEPV